ncbi:alpha-hydroxy acid oxidase [Actinoplanes auranticolor]|uniref:Alpha-hydroxy-acid oxidizing enzyme n=1 Tax=Actinoplanes auranticolor TaxID=47988 RepID=A0A919SEA1_9ACTN|nr:alpha-hydroxy acid oxidase [Actinoplanes auranticolor]GIM69485.1 alpha-hydroxy-acid oxidizing enzyme [Actinoplanes auranticolor]
MQEEAARAALPAAVFDYYRDGFGAQVTRDEATAAWREWRFVPRLFSDVSQVSTEIELLGARLTAPVLAGPTALHTLAHPEGEAATARGVAAAGSLFVLSSRAGRPLAEIPVIRPWWFQAYVLRDRQITEQQVRAAVAAGAGAIVLTADAPYVHPRPVPQAGALSPATRPADREQDPALDSGAIAWLAGIAGRPVLVKGVLSARDAAACVDAGAAGVIVSNHGGRQLDRVVATARALGPVVEAVAGRVPVLVDGGLRDGGDILTALALGAKAVLIGRPILWALATGGADGVRDCLDLYRTGLARTMAQAGLPTVSDINADVVTRA